MRNRNFYRLQMAKECKSKEGRSMRRALRKAGRKPSFWNVSCLIIGQPLSVR